MGMVWKYIFSPMKTGVVNSVLSIFGIDPIPWLSNNALAKFCVIFIAIWAQIGWHATLYLAFLQAIPADLYEQATVDGANSGSSSSISPCRSSCRASSPPPFCSCRAA